MHRGLDRLIREYRKNGACGFEDTLLDALESAALQLASDDSWDDEITNRMASLLLAAKEEYQLSGFAPRALEHLDSMYSNGREVQKIRNQWHSWVESTPISVPESVSTRELELAFRALRLGRWELVEDWLPEIEGRFLEAAEEYEALTIVENEVTAESVLGHRLLVEGIDGWLEALALLREGLESTIDESEIRQIAHQAQKKLLFVATLGGRASSDYC